MNELRVAILILVFVLVVVKVMRRFSREELSMSQVAISGEQAVIIYLDGVHLSAEIYDTYDAITIEDQLDALLTKEGLGTLDGDEIGPQETAIYFYGVDAEKMFVAMESTIRAYPLCKGARVLIRKGGPGAPEREVRIQ